jgi:hypothetical protein
MWARTRVAVMFFAATASTQACRVGGTDVGLAPNFTADSDPCQSGLAGCTIPTTGKWLEWDRVGFDESCGSRTNNQRPFFHDMHERRNPRCKPRPSCTAGEHADLDTNRVGSTCTASGCAECPDDTYMEYEDHCLTGKRFCFSSRAVPCFHIEASSTCGSPRFIVIVPTFAASASASFCIAPSAHTCAYRNL